MGWWEENVVYHLDAFKTWVAGWYRYIDDILLLWSGTHEDCHDFINQLNTNPWNIKLTAHISDVSVDFLDIQISFHPTHLKNGIPTGQFFRVKRNCSNEEDFKQHAYDLTSRFRDRGYPRKTISKGFLRAKNSERCQLLQTKVRPVDPRPRLITTYNNQWTEIHGILRKNWNILRSDNRLIPFLTDKPHITARRSKNLKDALTNSHFQRPLTPLGRGTRLLGSFPCGECSVCPFVLRSECFEDQTLKRKYKIRSYINCKTKGVIYILICPCRKLYVGQTTQELRKRCQQHLSTIRTASSDQQKGKKLTSVALHFLRFHGGCSRGLKIVGLEKVTLNNRGGDIVPLLLRNESRWIYMLNTMAPNGLNEELLFTGHYRT
ncbi:uncharacterized protein [Engystomops pustulosus]|uniref:uncharacterized protein n=1 Tax=Engystomops pustulosus TaxID=76066 RepID=UPI003AFB187A